MVSSLPSYSLSSWALPYFFFSLKIFQLFFHIFHIIYHRYIDLDYIILSYYNEYALDPSATYELAVLTHNTVGNA